MSNDSSSSDPARHARIRMLVGSAQRQAERANRRTGAPCSTRIAQPDRLGNADAPSSWLPGYEVVREIHRGGQGVVFEAVQHSTGRPVALKVMKEGPFADSSDRARFNREVRVLAQLNHPNIVAIHDSGRAEGHDYFVMDYIAGRPLDEHVHLMDERIGRQVEGAGKLDASPLSQAGRGAARRLLRNKLALFAQICTAVNAAHARGIIHRDLKPGNIRVDESGTAHVLDFGLAKISGGDNGPAAVTVAGQFVGSLPWASPESAAGQQDQIDIRSDVYSLGVVLYQMLTGHFPYAVMGPPREALDHIAKTEPRRPSLYVPAIDNEIETIVLKCLAKEPERRYQSAGELSRDVERYLAGDPIEAKRDSRLYVMHKLLRRHWAAATISATLAVVVAVATVISLTQWRSAAAARDRARAEAANAQALNEFMRSIFGRASPYNTTEHDVTVRKALEMAAQDVAAFSKGRPEVEAMVHMALAESFFGIGRPVESESQARSALATREQCFGHEHASVAQALAMLSLARYSQNDPAESEHLAREALEIDRRLYPVDHLDTAYALECLAKPLKILGRQAESESAAREALGMYQRLTGPKSAETARATANLASALQHVPEKAAELRQLTQDAIEINTSLFGRRHYLVGRGLSELGDQQYIAREFALAEQSYRAAIDIERDVLGPTHPDLLAGLANLASLLTAQDRLDEAEAIHRELLASIREVYGPDSERYCAHLWKLGQVLMRKGDEAGAEKSFREVLAIAERNRHPASLALRDCRILLAEMLLRRGDDAGAEPILLETLTEQDDSVPTGRWIQDQARSLMGQVLWNRGDWAGAETMMVDGANGLLAFRLAEPAARRDAVDRLVRFYEQRDAAEAGHGYAEKAAVWRARVPASGPAPKAPNSN